MKQQRETERTAAADRDHIPLGHPITVSSYNVRTLHQTGKFHQLCCGSLDAGIDIVGVQEHRLISTTPITEQWSDDKNWLFIHNSASKSRQGGVGLLVAKHLTKCINGTKCISDRIISVTLNGNPKLVVTVAYAPTEMADTDDKDEFYKTLRNHTSDNVKRHDVHLVIGDFNARLGKDSHEEAPRVVGPHLLHDVANNNGERLLSYCLESNLRHAQSRFPHPKSRLWTWTHPAGSHAQLDHILISSKWTNSLRNCRAYNSVELDSDHRILSATIKVSLRTTKGKPCNRKKFNWKRLADPQVKQEFQLKLANRFAALQDDEPITARYDQFESTTSSIAEEVVGKRAPTGLPNWVSSKTEDLRKARDDAKRKHLTRKTAVSRKRLKDLNLKLNASYQADQVKHLEDQLDTLTAADEKGETNKTWSIIHELSGKRRQSSVKVKKRDGNDPNSQQELLSEWKEYFKALLNNKSDIDAARPPNQHGTDHPGGDKESH